MKTGLQIHAVRGRDAADAAQRYRRRKPTRRSGRQAGRQVTGQATLLERIGGGDQAAVALCVERYSGLVWSLARRFIAVEADAEDAVQEIFVEIWNTAARFDPAKSAEATFISMIARRRLIDRLRKHKREPERENLEDVEYALSGDGHRALEASAETEKVVEVLNEMRPEQQQVIRMSTWLGMSHSAIAEETGMPLGTVKSLLRRGLMQIREQLGETRTADGGALS